MPGPGEQTLTSTWRPGRHCLRRRWRRRITESIAGSVFQELGPFTGSMLALPWLAAQTWVWRADLLPVHLPAWPPAYRVALTENVFPVCCVASLLGFALAGAAMKLVDR